MFCLYQILSFLCVKKKSYGYLTNTNFASRVISLLNTNFVRKRIKNVYPNISTFWHPSIKNFHGMFGFVCWQKLTPWQLNSGTNPTGLVARYTLCTTNINNNNNYNNNSQTHYLKQQVLRHEYAKIKDPI
jgi:hypothetical protein